MQKFFGILFDYLAAINEDGLCIQKTAKQKGHGYG